MSTVWVWHGIFTNKIHFILFSLLAYYVQSNVTSPWKHRWPFLWPWPWVQRSRDIGGIISALKEHLLIFYRHTRAHTHARIHTYTGRVLLNTQADIGLWKPGCSPWIKHMSGELLISIVLIHKRPICDYPRAFPVCLWNWSIGLNFFLSSQ